MDCKKKPGLIIILLVACVTSVTLIGYASSFMVDNPKPSDSLNTVFFSPDNRYAVELKAQPEFFVDGSIVYDVYLKTSEGNEKEIPEKILMASPAEAEAKDYVVWLSQDEFIINGEKVIKTSGEVEALRPLWGELRYASSFKVSPDKTKLALTGKDSNNNRVIKVIDLETRKVIATQIHPFKEPVNTGPLTNRIAWGLTDNVYYDVDVEGKHRVFQLDNGVLHLLFEDAKLINTSLDGRYLALIKGLTGEKPLTLIYDLQGNNVRGEISQAKRIFWLTEKEFIAVDLPGTSSQVEVYMINDQKLLKRDTFNLPGGILTGAKLEQGMVWLDLVSTSEDGKVRMIQERRTWKL
ncbi:hypothetical protein V3F56_09735 [Moorellaceae bacterium AZ2]